MRKIISILFVVAVPYLLIAQCLQGDCRENYSILLFENQDKYYGEFRHGQPHGQGMMVYANGGKYKGQWKNGSKEGQGQLTLSKVQYTGQFRKDKFSGEGTMVYANRNKYVGQWANNRQHGIGIYYFSNGERYEGEFQDGAFHGFGIWFYMDGQRYEGQWKNGKREGEGFLFTANGNRQPITYAEGNRVNQIDPDNINRNCNLQYCHSGKGTFTYYNGNIYKGQFFKGNPRGVGMVIYTDGRIYKGSWEEDQPHGIGTMTYKTGDSKKAYWSRGEIQSIIDQQNSNPRTPSISNPNQSSVKVWAIIVGVSDYSHMQRLRYTDDDAYLFHSFLKSPQGGAVASNQIKILIDESASKENILQEMRSVFFQADEDDVILFFFSGHGLAGSFVPYDFDGYANLLEHREVSNIMANSRAKHKIVIADACFSGSMEYYRSSTDELLAEFYHQLSVKDPGTALLLSSKDTEYSLEDNGLRSGVFSYYLIKGLEGYADSNMDSFISIYELFSFVSNRVRNYTGGRQSPIIKGDFDGSLPIGIVRN